MKFNINVLLLAAGKGTRLLPYTKYWPKCLMPINEFPLMDYWLTPLAKITDKIFINKHHHHKIIEDYLKIDSYRNFNQIHEERLLGTAGTIRKLIKEQRHIEKLLVIHADNLSIFDLESFINFHSEKRFKNNAYMSMMTFNTNSPRDSGIAYSENHKLVKFIEKPLVSPHNVANAAIYIIEKEIINFILSNHSIKDFSTQVIPLFLGKIYTWHNSNFHIDIGNIKNLHYARKVFKNKKLNFNLNSNFEWYKGFLKSKIVQELNKINA